MTEQEVLNKVKNLTPIANNSSLHIDEFIYKVDGDEIKLYYAIGGYDKIPLIEVNGKSIN